MNAPICLITAFYRTVTIMYYKITATTKFRLLKIETYMQGEIEPTTINNIINGLFSKSDYK